MTRVRLLIPAYAVLLPLVLLLSGPVLAQDAASTPDTQQMTLSQIHHQQADGLEWWTFSDLSLHPADVEDAKISAHRLNGEGRILFKAGHERTVTIAPMMLTLQPGSVAFVDRVGEQVRVMLLAGKANVNDGQRQIQLNTSLQAVRIPSVPPDYFIDDGVYRRPPMERFQDETGKTIVRQFYLEQVIFSDPILRTLYQESPETRSWIRRLNKRGAILRNLNGTWQYEEGQV